MLMLTIFISTTSCLSMRHPNHKPIILRLTKNYMKFTLVLEPLAMLLPKLFEVLFGCRNWKWNWVWSSPIANKVFISSQKLEVEKGTQYCVKMKTLGKLTQIRSCNPKNSEFQLGNDDDLAMNIFIEPYLKKSKPKDLSSSCWVKSFPTAESTITTTAMVITTANNVERSRTPSQ